MDDSEKLYAYLCEFLSARRQRRFEEVLSYRTRHFTVVTEDIYQEQNASAIVRTCDCLGIQDVHIIERGNSHRISRAIARGAEKWVDIHYYQQPPYANSTLACVNVLREQGYRIVAASPHQEEKTVAEFSIDTPAAFFLGHEKHGLSEEVVARADSLVTVPAYGFTESYNVSVAMSLLLYPLVHRLHLDRSISWQLSEQDKQKKRIEWAKKSILNVEKILERYPSS